jgi:hypothetical protein
VVNSAFLRKMALLYICGLCGGYFDSTPTSGRRVPIGTPHILALPVRLERTTVGLEVIFNFVRPLYVGVSGPYCLNIAQNIFRKP